MRNILAGTRLALRLDMSLLSSPYFARRSVISTYGFVIIAVFAVAACASDNASVAIEDAGGADGEADSQPASDAGSDATNGSSLTLSLDPTIDQDDDTVQAATLTSADLLDAKGATLKSASLAGGAAVFDLVGVAAGDYFILVNGITDHLVPTRIADPSAAIRQRVGQKLSASYIGPVTGPTYRIATYPDGQVVKFSDDTPILNERPYLIVALAPSTVEFRVLGSGAMLTSLPLNDSLGHSDVHADAWLLNTNGEDHHGDIYAADGGPTCATCHFDYWMNKPFSSLNPSKGWCFRCHDGTDGSGAGFVDPLQ